MRPPMSDGSPRKDLGAFHAAMLVMGGILGVGIFFNPAQVASAVPSEPAFLTAWLLGGMIAVCGAFTFAELGGSFPRAGGWYVYLREIYGSRCAFLFAWVVLFVISTGALSVMAGFCASMLSRFAPGLGASGSLGQRALATGLILGVTALALGGMRVGAGFQSAVMVAKLVAVAALAGACFFAFGGEPAAAAPAVERSGSAWKGLPLAMLAVLFSCGGWQMLGYAAASVREPERTVPRAILAGVGGVLVAYLLLNLGYLRVLGIGGLAGDSDFASRVARLALGARGEAALSFAMALSALGVIVVTALLSPWLYVALAREGDFFRGFGRLNARTGAPVLALLFQCALTTLYVWLVDPNDLVSSVVFVEWIFHGLVAYGLIRLRRTRPELPRPFRSLAFPLFPALYLIAAIGVVVGALAQAEARLTLTGIGVVAVGLAVDVARGRLARRARVTAA